MLLRWVLVFVLVALASSGLFNFIASFLNYCQEFSIAIVVFSQGILNLEPSSVVWPISFLSQFPYDHLFLNNYHSRWINKFETQWESDTQKHEVHFINFFEHCEETQKLTCSNKGLTVKMPAFKTLYCSHYTVYIFYQISWQTWNINLSRDTHIIAKTMHIVQLQVYNFEGLLQGPDCLHHKARIKWLL